MAAEIDVFVAGEATRESYAEWVTLVEPDRADSARALAETAAPLLNSQIAAGLLFLDAADPLVQAWSRLPLEIAALSSQPSSHFAVFFHKSALVGEVPRSADDVWRHLIRIASQGGGAEVLGSLPTNHRSARSPRLPELAPSEPFTSMNWLKTAILEAVSGRVPQSPDATALAAGLLQLNDFLDASHNLSQSIEGEGRSRAGDYWHGIMHCREPDYSNAKYWFRRVGAHPVHAVLASQVASRCDRHGSAAARHWRERLKAGVRWDALAFVDMCEQAAQSSDAELIDLAEQIQFTEMLLLLEHTYRDATA